MQHTRVRSENWIKTLTSKLTGETISFELSAWTYISNLPCGYRSSSQPLFGNCRLITSYKLEAPSGELIKVMKHVNIDGYNP